MNTIASRFLSFEEPLGAGLVKFAYFVIAAVLLVLMVIAMIAGIVAMFEVGFLTGLGRFVLAPLQFLLALILLRIGTEVVLAILSIDDNLTDGARTEGAMPIPSPKEAIGGSGLPKSPDTSVTEASKDENQRAPFAAQDGDQDADTSRTEASKDENQRAPFAAKSGASSEASSGSSSGATSSASSEAGTGGAKTVGTAPARKTTKKTATKKATKKAPAASSASGASSSASAKKTAEAAKAATRPSASDDEQKGSS